MLSEPPSPIGTAAPLAAVESTDVAPTPVRRGRRRRRRQFGAALAAGWMLLVVLLAALQPLLPLQDPQALSGDAREPPSAAHWLGTDQLSRDQLSRVISGAQVSLVVGIVSALLAGIVGSLLGLVVRVPATGDGIGGHGPDGHHAGGAGADLRHRRSRRSSGRASTT